MKIIPEVKCRRCGESFPALRSSCPNCGTRRVAQSTRTPAPTPSTTAGTAAYERANVNTKWQMIFGLILVAAVILAVIVMVSTGLNDDSYGAKTKPTKAPTAASTEAPDVAPTAEPVPTPTPSPTPTVQTLEIRYKWDDRKLTDITLKIGEEVPMFAAIMPVDIKGTVKWRIDDEGKDAFQIIEEEDNHVTIRCLDRLPDGCGGVNLYAEVYGQTVICKLHVNPNS